MSNYIDTRDLYKRKCELEELRAAVTAAQEELDQHLTRKPDEIEDSLEAFEEWDTQRDDLQDDLDAAQADFGDDEAAELAELEELESEISDFRHGETMIPVYDFEDYARQFAEDIGALEDCDRWPATCLDWKEAAEELSSDFTEVEYQGTSYYVRA